MQEIMEDTGAYVWITHDPLNYAHSDKIIPAFDTGGELLVERVQEGLTAGFGPEQFRPPLSAGERIAAAQCCFTPFSASAWPS